MFLSDFLIVKNVKNHESFSEVGTQTYLSVVNEIQFMCVSVVGVTFHWKGNTFCTFLTPLQSLG